MSHEIIPADQPEKEPNDSSKRRASSSDDTNRKRRRRAGASAIPTREDCLRLLHHLGGLVAMKLIPPAQANALRAIYQTILQELGRAAAGLESPLSDEVVLRLLRDNPETLSLIEPFLSQEQIDLIMPKDGNDAEPNA